MSQLKLVLKHSQLMQYFNLHTHHFTDQEPVVELVNQYPWEFDERIKTY
jgi:TatD DNase family protein